MTTPVPTSTLEPAANPACLNIDTVRRMSALMLVASERLFKLQREVNEGTFAVNAEICHLPADMAETAALMDRWPRLVEENNQRFLDANRTCVDIFAQTQIEMVLVFSDIVSTDIRRQHVKKNANQRAPVEKRVAAKVIQFPDRRVAIATALSDLVGNKTLAGDERPRAKGKRIA